MHEMSLAEGILQLLEEQSRVQQFRRVKTLWLEIGPLAAVEVEALRFCLEVVTRHTLAEGAQVEIVAEPAQAWCLVCERSVDICQRYDPCPLCGGHQLQVIRGDALRLKELEVE